MSEARVLVVTVGTSLFSSASWRCEGDFAKVKGYSEWTKHVLNDPHRRRTEYPDTEERIRKLLTAGTQATARRFELDVDHPLRYSGELTTLIRMYQRPGAWTDVPAFLRHRYARIELLAPTNEANESRVAARHLEVILAEKLGHPNTTLPNALRSPHLLDLVPQLRHHLAALAASGEEVDLLVTGGYKAFALLAGKFVATQPENRSWQAFYVHEDAEAQLIVEGRSETWVADTEVPDTAWPPLLRLDG